MMHLSCIVPYINKQSRPKCPACRCQLPPHVLGAWGAQLKAQMQTQRPGAKGAVEKAPKKTGAKVKTARLKLGAPKAKLAAKLAKGAQKKKAKKGP